MTSVTRLAVALFLTLAAGCSDPTDNFTRFHEDAKAAWAANGPASYTLVVNRTCICDGPSEPVLVTVQNGTVTSRVIIGTGEPVVGFDADYPSVPGFFAMIDDARRIRAYSITVEYDSSVGYPTLIILNFNAGSVTDDRTFSIGPLNALP